MTDSDLSRYGEGQRPTFLLDWFAAGQRIALLLNRELPKHGLRSDEYGVYSLILLYGPLSPTALADMAGMPLTTMSDFLQRIRERGHLEDAPHPTDRRSYVVSLTATGKQAHARVRPEFQRILKRIESQLDLDVEIVRDMIAAIDKAVRAVGDELDRADAADLTDRGGTARPR